ncbi:hypothetical protein [Anaerocolumna chitinilytica]|uniref:Uncharacterized protein n=1 Tax=Anaerocolumna chitinilytica TaxID=1727145 RepID=A0A7I8DIF8_9FIRM|nr:hypothetical protein [Anaerocolumna chitinilytica]BCJ97051.1 hypothetical protein bsdcttw_00920 [Anaerocolumna chitinilytica]
MEIVNNLDVILSVVCSIGSIIMFFKAKNEKDQCIKIRTEIKNDLRITNDSKEIKSKDEFNIKQVNTFDNRKTIR